MMKGMLPLQRVGVDEKRRGGRGRGRGRGSCP